MRNIFTLVFSLFVAGIVFGQAERMVLLEEFTNASCPPCASQNPAFNELIDQNRDRVVPIKWQTPFPGFDPMNQHHPEEVDAHLGRYGSVYPAFGGVPTAFIDGVLPGFNFANGQGAWGTPQTGYRGGPYGYNQAVIDFAASQTAPVEIQLDHNIFAQNDSVQVSMQVVNVSSNTISGNLKVHMILMERDIIFECGPPGSTNEFEFHDIARRKLTGLTGMTVDNIPPGDTLQLDMSFPVPAYIYTQDQMYVSGYLQDWTSLEVFNAAVSYPKPLDYLKDVSFGNRPSSNDALCEESFNPAALVENLGQDTVQNMSISYSFNGNTVTKDFDNMNLAPASVYVAEFDETTHPGGGLPIIYEIVSIDGSASDGNRFNDLDCEPFVAKKAASPDFEEGDESFDRDIVGEAPVNFNVNGEYTGAFVVADQEFLGSVGSAGFRSSQGVLVDFYNWPTDQFEQRAEMVYLLRQDFSNIENINLSFHYFKAFRSSNPSYSDSLLLQASTDCGVTWETIWSISGSSWATASGTDDFATPRFSSSWEEQVISLESLSGEPDVTLKMVAVNGGGNTLVLDELILEGEESVNTQIALANQVRLWPNPVQNEAVQISLPTGLKVNAFRVYDLSGRVIDQQEFSNFQTDRMSWMPRYAGAFIMELDTNEGRVSKRIMVIE